MYRWTNRCIFSTTCLNTLYTVSTCSRDALTCVDVIQYVSGEIFAIFFFRINAWFPLAHTECTLFRRIRELRKLNSFCFALTSVFTSVVLFWRNYG